MSTTSISQTPTAADVTAAVDRYLAAYNERDAARRAKLVAAAWTEDGELVDPPLTGAGHAGIGELAAAVHAQFPGHAFRRASAVDEHHGFARVAWELVDEAGAVALAGLDVAEVAPDGRLRRVVGFFGATPPPLVNA